MSVAGGRKLGRPLNDPDAIARARDELAKGIGINRVAKQVALSNGTVLVVGGYIDNAGNSTGSAELYEPVAVLPTSLLFLNQIAGTTSAPQAVTLTNNESTALSITSVAVNGTNASDFAETDNCVGSVPAGASCSVNVTFTPAAAGIRSGSLNIANNLSGSPVPVPLTGTGVALTRTVSRSPSSLTFTNQTQGITLNNTGNSTLTKHAIGE